MAAVSSSLSSSSFLSKRQRYDWPHIPATRYPATKYSSQIISYRLPDQVLIEIVAMLPWIDRGHYCARVNHQWYRASRHSSANVYMDLPMNLLGHIRNDISVAKLKAMNIPWSMIKTLRFSCYPNLPMKGNSQGEPSFLRSNTPILLLWHPRPLPQIT
jgi:hypothetical protein